MSIYYEFVINMIKWTKLQLNMLPIIAIQADEAIKKLEQLVRKVNTTAFNQDIYNLNELRLSIINRIQALDKFYELNHLDSTISIFHMIKLKLKKSVFKLQNIDNETISIQLPNAIKNLESQPSSIMASSRKKKIEQNSNLASGRGKQSNFKIQIEPISKSKSKSKSKSRMNQRKKDDILKLLQTSRGEEEDTNLMDQHAYVKFNQRINDHSFEFNNQELQAYEPLFNNDYSNKPSNKKYNMNKISHIKNSNSISPHNKKQVGANKNHLLQNASTTPGKIKHAVGSGNQHKAYGTSNKLAYNTSSKLDKVPKVMQKPSQKSTKLIKPVNMVSKKQIDSSGTNSKKMKTEGEEIRIAQEQGLNKDNSEFRFTIKMTKQQYKNLLKMKQMLKNGKLI